MKYFPSLLTAGCLVVLLLFAGVYVFELAGKIENNEDRIGALEGQPALAIYTDQYCSVEVTPERSDQIIEQVDRERAEKLAKLAGVELSF